MRYVNNKDYNDNYINAWSVAISALSGKKNVINNEGLVNTARGYKVCYINNIENITFSGLGFGNYKISDNACCEKKRNKCKYPVNLDCDCGFYAFYDRSKAFNLVENYRGLYAIEVELFGKIIMHKEGMRGCEQDVIRVFLPKKCSNSLCNKAGNYLAAKESLLKRNIKYLVKCEKHSVNTKCYKIESIKNVDLDIVRV